MKLVCVLEQDIVMRRDAAIGFILAASRRRNVLFLLFPGLSVSRVCISLQGGYVCGRFSNELFSSK